METNMDEILKKNIDMRLSSAEGHLKAIRKMLAEGRSCEDLLTQLSAVESMVHRAGVLVLKNHLNHCVVDGLKRGDVNILDRFNTLLDKYLGKGD